MMKTKFMVGNSTVSVIQLNEDTALDVLPPRIYTMEYNELAGFYLTINNEQLQVPEKVYGNTHDRVDKCVKTYTSRDTSTGILLTGDKGTGKTLLMSLLANRIINENNLPVILIREPYSGQAFTSFVELIGECCLVFDEFGKMYRNSRHEEGIQQEALLSLFDGVDKTKRMIIMTENSEIDISEFMFNRPSRVYYHFKYRKLDEASINGYCDDHGVAVSILAEIIDVSRRSMIFSFDMLQSIVEEHLRFPDLKLDSLISDLNIDIRKEWGIEIQITDVIAKVGKQKRTIVGPTTINKPSGYSYGYIKLKKAGAKKKSRGKQATTLEDIELACSSDDDDKYDEIHFRSSDLAYESAGKMVFETDDFTIIAKELPQKTTEYTKYF